jgi:predicted nucleotidyltransferase
MVPHHAETLARVSEHFSKDPEVTALVLCGSIAHGFSSADSDVDVMILVADEAHQERLRAGRVCFFSRELCTYLGGYVDGKYTTERFIREVQARGSEPARFAFKDAQVLFSRGATLASLLEEAARYPSADKAERLRRFQAQFEAWFWYCAEALKRHDLPLLRTAVSKLILFGGRIVLTHNELLYPYHKWFLRVLADAPEKPLELLSLIDALTNQPSRENIDRFAHSVREFRGWEISHATWPAQFMQDSELNWLHHPPPIDDI